MSKEKSEENLPSVGEGLKLVALGEHVCPLPGRQAQEYVYSTGRDVYYQCLECKAYSRLREMSDGQLVRTRLGVFEVVRLQLLGRIPYKVDKEEQE